MEGRAYLLFPLLGAKEGGIIDKRAWVHQLKAQVEKQGADAASWYVSWTDPSGKQCRKSCGPGRVGKSAANTLADKIHSQLVTGTYAAGDVGPVLRAIHRSHGKPIR